MKPGILVLAAGQSRRFGQENKLLAMLDGRPLLSHVLAQLPPGDHRLVVVSDPQVARLAQAAGFEVLQIAPGGPQSLSLREGVRAFSGRDTTQLLVALGDMPWLRAGDYATLIALAGAGMACVSAGEVLMPPAIFTADRFADLCAMRDDRGAASLLQSVPPSRRLQLAPERLKDVDRPGDLPGP